MPYAVAVVSMKQNKVSCLDQLTVVLVHRHSNLVSAVVVNVAETSIAVSLKKLAHPSQCLVSAGLKREIFRLGLETEDAS